MSYTGFFSSAFEMILDFFFFIILKEAELMAPS